MRTVIASLFLITCFQANARKPAIEPISGISIDNVETEKKTMFEFDKQKLRGPSSKENLKSEVQEETPTSSPSNTFREVSSVDQQSSDLPLFLLLLPMFALPFIARFILKKKALAPTTYGKLKVIQGEKKDDHYHGDDDHIKKAS